MQAKHTMGQAAKLLGVSKSTLYRWEKTGKIAAPKRLSRTKERIYTDEDIAKIREWKDRTEDPPRPPSSKSIGKKR